MSVLHYGKQRWMWQRRAGQQALCIAVALMETSDDGVLSRVRYPDGTIRTVASERLLLKRPIEKYAEKK